MKDNIDVLYSGSTILRDQQVTGHHLDVRGLIVSANDLVEPCDLARGPGETPQVATAHFKESIHNSSADKARRSGHKDAIVWLDNQRTWVRNIH
jgi:hypothetical protein